MTSESKGKAVLITCSCGAAWTGASRCHCAACHLTFSGLTAFDRHRDAMACRPPEDVGLTARTKVANGRRFTLWGWPGNYSRDEFETGGEGE